MSNFAWHEVSTNDKEGAIAFYTGLFGWTTRPGDFEGYDYTVLSNNGVDFGGISPIPSEGVPPNWSTTVRVPDVDAATDRAKAAGATIYHGPESMEGIGRFVVFGDPQGAGFALLTDDEALEPVAPGVPPHGGITWHELTTSDVEGARAFYNDVIGWDSVDRDMGEMVYSVFTQGEAMMAGFMAKPDEVPVSSWTIYFEVANIDESVELAKKLGGNIFMDVMEVPGIGRMAWAADPQGAVFAMMTSSPMP